MTNQPPQVSRFPCARCGSDRTDLEAECSQCGWSPDTFSDEDQRTHHIPRQPQAKQEGNQLAGFICVMIGSLICLGAVSWLTVTVSVGEFAPILSVAGVFQLLIGAGFVQAGRLHFANAATRTRTTLACFVCLMMNLAVIVASLFLSGMQSISGSRPIAQPRLSVKDPNSPTLVYTNRTDGAKVSLPVVISVDGVRPTHYAGWPVELVGDATVPVSLTWLTDPDRVRMHLDNHQTVELTWDHSAVDRAWSFEARLSALLA